MRKSVRLKVDWKSVGKYLIAAASAALVLLVLPNTTTLTLTFGKALAGLATYIAVLLAIDAEARKLPPLIIREIKMALGGVRKK
jgi:hypothetical protein